MATVRLKPDTTYAKWCPALAGQRKEAAMTKRIACFVYGVACYVVFLGTFLYAIGFIGNVGVPTALDGPAKTPLATALAANTALLGLFALQHSIMARRWFKQRWTRIIPRSIERSTYVLFSSVALILLFSQWRPMGGEVWAVENPWGQVLLLGGFAFGWLLVLVSTFLIDHFDLFGLRQVLAVSARDSLHRPRVRHARAVSPRQASALRRMVVHLLDDADDDRCAPPVRGGDDVVHPYRDPVRGTGPGA
jgi:protein-S-isoprenylcysteine O-methyltransferase Ste14